MANNKMSTGKSYYNEVTLPEEKIVPGISDPLKAYIDNIPVAWNDIEGNNLKYKSFDKNFKYEPLNIIGCTKYIQIDNYLEKLISYGANRVTNLNFKNCRKLTGQTWDLITKFTKLTHLNLGQNDIGPQGARVRGCLINLTRLNIELNHIGDEGARTLGSLIKLTHLNICYNNIGPPGIEALGVLIKLNHLNIGQINISAGGIETLTGLTKLTNLNFSPRNFQFIELPALKKLFHQNILWNGNTQWWKY